MSDTLSTSNTEEGFVNINTKKSRNLVELEQTAKLNSGNTVGATHYRVSESYSGQVDITGD